jgi:hypothetical protein
VLSTNAVTTPSSSSSTFSVHNYDSIASVDLTGAHSSKYSSWVSPTTTKSPTPTPPPSTKPTTTPTSTSTTPPDPQPTCTEGHYGQCGGTGWTGCTVCGALLSAKARHRSLTNGRDSVSVYVQDC